LNAASGKYMTSRIERAPAAIAAATGVGVVNQQSVVQIRQHV
jgi:hypothetical protein